MSVRDLVILGSSSQQPTRFRSHGAYLLRWNNQGFLFDPGEGTQRQFIFANVSPTTVTKILISHFHGDHCLGLSSMLMKLNLDKVKHKIICYYPASGRAFFKRLRYCSSYHQTIEIVEVPISSYGIVDENDDFIIEAFPLQHSIENLGWRITEKPKRRYIQERLDFYGISGVAVRHLISNGVINIDGRSVYLDDVSYMSDGDVFAYVSDTRICSGAFKTAEGADLFLCESTYLESEKHLASKHLHMTAHQAATIASTCNVKKLVLTHFSARYFDLRMFFSEARKVFKNTVLAQDLMNISFPRNQKR